MEILSKKYYVRILGGLGNQLYIMAYAKYLERKYGIKAKLINHFRQHRSEETKVIDRTLRNLYLTLFEPLGFKFVHRGTWESVLAFRLCSPLTNKYEEEKEAHGVFLEHGLPPKLHTSKYFGYVNIINGYFQSHKYILPEFLESVRRLLTSFTHTLTIMPEDVAIHIRRGDFLQYSLYHKYGARHYLSGLRLLEEKEKIGKVYVFSDDFSAIQEELRDIREHYDVVPVQGMSVMEDLYAMTSFRRYVLANSTFSWWGAFLSQYGEDVEVVVPDKPLSVSHPEDSFFPPHWIKILNTID